MNPAHDPTARLRMMSDLVREAAERQQVQQRPRPTVTAPRSTPPTPRRATRARPSSSSPATRQRRATGTTRTTRTTPRSPSARPTTARVEPGGAVLTADEMAAVDHLLATHPQTAHMFREP